MKRLKITIISMTLATTAIAQGVMDVHSHLITPEFVSSLEKEGRLMDEGFPLPKYDVYNHLKWMDEAGVETSVLTLAAPQPTSAQKSDKPTRLPLASRRSTLDASCSVLPYPCPMYRKLLRRRNMRSMC
jgi:hypothetical protein